MSEITPSLVKQLRELTGAGMMDCKRALAETGGDVEAATDWLRKKGLAAAAKKSGRVAAEGLIGLRLEGTMGALVEVNSETDFVARNETFQALVRHIAGIAPGARGDVEALKRMVISATGRTVADEITQAIAVIGENINLRRTAFLEVREGLVAGYVHNQVAVGLGKLGVLVGLASSAPPAALAELGKQLAMHIAAANPQAVDVAALDPAVVARERAIFAEQARASGKPESIIEKMVEGRLRKFYEEAVLLEQAFVVDPDKRVKQVVEAAAKAAGAPITVSGFVRMQLGEGIEKEATDLAAEVEKLTRS
ncbi:MAG: translation elongation factor Ts [Geminicoccaceae bacterium]|nr:translation elongation factor Ts [Geminicoccaceae bacterium]MCX8100333.1 translation elongation factor Ts [Geminicoccaceae bacterium]MDW8368721.1 translation elongation factor Ts [Geminicoccaceae bacterium]